MARKPIDIGTVGNDGTGDSIRDSFRKVNDNFLELYSVLGLGEKLTFKGLDDTPSSYAGYDKSILVVDADPTTGVQGIKFKPLVEGNGIKITQTDNEITFQSLFASISGDSSPQLGGPVSAAFGTNRYPIGNLPDLRSTSEFSEAIARLTTVHGTLSANSDRVAANKGYVDTKIARAGVNAIDPKTGTVNPDWGRMTGPLILSRDPEPADDDTYNGLVAATKRYVDSSAFGSSVNLYVATSGQDERPGVSPALQGRALAYAYRSIEAALKRAEEIMLESRVEIGPYKKVLTYGTGAGNCTLSSITVAPDSGSGFTGATVFMSIDTIVLSASSLDFNYRSGDLITLAVGTGTSAQVEVLAVNSNGEILSFRLITPGVYSVLPGGFNIPSNTNSAFGGGATFDVTYKVNSVSVPTGGSGSGYGLVSVRIERGVGDTTGTGAFGTADVVDGKIVSITITDQGSGFTNTPVLTVNLPRFKVFTAGGRTDFTGNVSSSSTAAVRTRDIRDGLYLRGEESGALAQILAHRGELDGPDELFDVDIKYGAFIIGEVLSYGDVTKLTQISVLIESGTYEENYPLKVPQNVAIIGDEFRRVIMKPKVGVSSSPWAFQYFKRDLEIDGTVTAEQEFGWHYLADTTQPVYPLINNKGYYRSAAQLLALNKSFLQDEITAWIAHQIATATTGSIWKDFTYDANLCARDVGLIIDAYTFDLRWGGYNRTVSAALKYQSSASALIAIGPLQLANTTAAINYLDVLAQQIIANTAIPTVYNGTRSQIIDLAFVAEAGSGTVITSLKDVVIDFINGSGAGVAIPNFPKDNNDLDVFLCNDAVIIRAVTSQGHGGFMMVLDPEGQILAKSPYAQECASFSRSNGKKRFSGGMYVDGFSGNIEFEIYDKAFVGAGNFVIGNSYTIKTLGTTDFTLVGATANTVGLVFIATGVGAGDGTAYNNLFLRVRGLARYPNLPASFIVQDTVYRINYVRDFVYSPSGSTASFILDETTPWTTPIFTYDSTICSRDVGLIINGLQYDVVLGTNYNQRRAGLSYRQANAHVVVDNQLSYTISAIEEAHDLVNAEIPGSSYATTRSLVDVSKSNIVNILRNGTIGAPTLSFTNPTGLSTDKANAKILLQSNIEFFRDELVGWVDAQVVGNISPFTSAFVYDSSILAREVQYIVEAVIYNMLYGGNDAVVYAGLSFYDGVGTAVSWQYETGAETKYAAAVDYLKYLAKQAVQDLAPTTTYSSTARVTGTAAGGTVPNEVEAFIAVVSSIVTAGTYGSSITSPSFTTYSYDSNKKLAVAEFTDPTTKAGIQSAVVTFVDSIANRYEVLMPGNRSMLANDFTQVNDMGYGLVTNNGGLLEAVSVFTYYCYISYYSRNGGQIRSVAGSSAHGRFALVAEGADPLEIPTPVTLYQDLATGATIVSTGIYLNSAGGLIVYINNFDVTPLNNGELEVVHTDGNLYRYSVTSVTTIDLPAGYAQLNISSTGNSTTAGLAFAIPDGTKVTIRALSQVALTGDIVDVATRPSTALKLNETEPVYRVLQFQAYTDPEGAKTCTISVANPTTITSAAHGQLPGYIVIFSSTGTLPTGLTAGVKYYVLDNGLSVNAFRVSLSKNGTPIAVTAAGSGTHSFVAGGLARTTLRENYDYVELVPWSPNEYRGSTFTVTVSTPATAPLFTTASAHGLVAGDVVGFTTTGSLPVGVSETRNYFVIASGLSATEFRVSATPGGSSIDTTGTTQSGVHTVGAVRGYVGDTSFAIVALSAADKTRVVGMKVVYLAEEYTVTLYEDETATGEPYGRVHFNRGLVDDILTYSSPPTLKGGVAKRINASSGTLTIRISLTRVTGHDLLEIGTGSYADTNYPNEIYGGAVNPLDEDAEVEERGSGRTFYVTTDQFGNFRVGPYFRVDQGTGKVTFSAAIALSNLDGLGFKRGVPISEFSPDSSMANNATDTVPTQNAVRTYIERRLGVTHDGNRLSDDAQIIPPLTGGFMALNGVTIMNEDMDLGDNKIINVDDPVLPKDAVNLQSLTWDNFQDFSGTNLDAADLLVFTGAGNSSVNATVIGDVSFNLTTGADSALNQVDVQITPNTIINADINASAAIDQSKLNLDSAYATTEATLNVTATGTGAIEFLASISGTTLTVLTSGPSGTLIVPGLSITGGVVPENTYIVANISGTGLGSTWTLNNAVTQPSALLTASQVALTFSAQPSVPFVAGQRIVVSGLSVSGYNGIKTVTTCTTTQVTYGGTTTGSATGGTVKALRGISTYDTTQFTVTDGYVTVKENGLVMSRIQKIPTKTVLANSDAITNNVTAVTFATVILDGGAIRKAQYSSNGFLRKVASTGIEASDYAIVEATTGAAGYATGDASKLMIRSSSGDIGARILTLDGNDGSGQGLKLKMPAESSATLTLSRTSTATGGSTRLYGFNGQGGVLIGSGSLPTDPTTYYDNDFHSFRKQDGVTAAPITASSIQVTTLTAGGPTVIAKVIGRWQLDGVGSRMQATYAADLAEFYEGDKEYPVGTVLIFGGDKEVTISNSKEDHRIAGVVSDTAAYTMYGACPGHKNLIALQGRVPVRVVGKIAKGDLLVTSSVAGVAVSAGGVAKTGTVVGKALENYNSDHIGTIEVAVGRT